MTTIPEHVQPQDDTRVGFKDLPVELVLEIAFYLSDLERLVLALTCKPLMNILDSSKELQRSPKVNHPGSISYPAQMHQRIHPLYGPGSDRWKLLVYLQNSRWRLCHGCLRLHPRNEFPLAQLKNPAWKRKCMFGPRVGFVRL